MKAAQEQLVIRAREKYESKQIEKHSLRNLPQTQTNVHAITSSVKLKKYIIRHSYQTRNTCLHVID
jgi:hypothetical protein